MEYDLSDYSEIDDVLDRSYFVNTDDSMEDMDEDESNYDEDSSSRHPIFEL